MTVKEFKDKVYEKYTEAINAISIASKEVRGEEHYQADIGVSTDIFINFVDANSESLFVNVKEAKEFIAELRSQIG